MSGPLLFSGDRPFTSLLHVLLPKFCSCSRDPLAWRVDTISFPWSGLHLYVLPPFSMFTRVLERVVQDLAELALLAPFFGCGGHGSPSCFLLAGLPRRLPCHLVLFTQPLFLLSHLRIETLLLSLWLFSVFRVYSHVFMTEQQFSPQRPSETPLALLMIPFGNASLYGAHDSVIFLFCLFRSDCGFSCLFVRQSFVSFYYLLLQVCYCFLSFKKTKNK